VPSTKVPKTLSPHLLDSRRTSQGDEEPDDSHLAHPSRCQTNTKTRTQKALASRSASHLVLAHTSQPTPLKLVYWLQTPLWFPLVQHQPWPLPTMRSKARVAQRIQSRPWFAINRAKFTEPNRGSMNRLREPTRINRHVTQDTQGPHSLYPSWTKNLEMGEPSVPRATGPVVNSVGQSQCRASIQTMIPLFRVQRNIQRLAFDHSKLQRAFVE
jgi:hypothetical protein